MSTKNDPATESSQQAFVISRVFDAPVETVWKAITDLDQMKQWYFDELESFKPEVGFQTRVTVRHEGKEYPHIWKVTDVAAGKRITYSWKYEGKPGESFVTFELFAEGRRTRLKLTHTGLETFRPEDNPDLARKNFVEGWTSLIGSSLKEFLEGTTVGKADATAKKEFVISRTFDAPRALVWKAFTEPERMKQWWGPKGFTVKVSKMDLRPGGTYHYCLNSPDGKEMWGKMVYREIVPPERLVFINSFSDEKGGVTRHPMSPGWPLEMLSTFTFTEQAGKTTFTVRWIPINETDEEYKTFDTGRDSMKQGWGGTMEQLAGYLEKAVKESRKS